MRTGSSLSRALTVLVALATIAAGGPLLSSRIKHVIVLMEENRSFDHLLGWYTRPGSNSTAVVNGLNGSEYNLKNCSDPNSEKIYVTKNAPYVNECDPDHDTPPTTFKIFGPSGGDNHTVPTMEGFAMFEYDRHNGTEDCNVLDMFDTREKLPVLTALVDEFLLFDHLFAAVPGPTWPNREFFMSATSMGLTRTYPWYRDDPGRLYPQKTIFDQVAEAGGTWKLYYQDTPWELFMESLAHNPENLHTLDQFYADVAQGTLPSFAFINPRGGINVTTGEGSNDDHPDHDVALAEAHYKNIYEAIRNGPAWNETLFVLTFDEHGGFYDHVPPPAGVPPPDDSRSYPAAFSFERLGIRIPTLLISPWVAKGRVESAPPPSQRPFPNSEYDLTSIIASTRKILGVMNGTGPLTWRDAWVATWEHLLTELDEPRLDCPTELPPPPPPHKKPKEEAEQPINDLQKHLLAVHAGLAGVSYPHHLSQQGEVAEWLQQRYQEHREATLLWKDSKVKREYYVNVAPYETKHHHYHFHIKQDANGTQKMTIYIHFKDKEHWCLDGNGMVDGSRLESSRCYPSIEPAKNRDTDQWWTWHPDSTLRPFQNASLCATDRFYQNETQPGAFLSPCQPGDVRQHWGYSPGEIAFGCGSGKLILVKK